MMDIAGYFSEIKKIHASGHATEHSYRPALEKLFKSITPDVDAINEPKGVKVGRPDFVFVRQARKGAQITVGHCEAKDVGLDINPKAMNDFNKAQHERYVKALPNLIYTNGLDFAFYKKGELTRQISIGNLLMGLQPKPDQFGVLANQLKDFTLEKLQTITSAEDLAQMMAGKAALIKDVLFNSIKEDRDLNTELTGQYKSFKDMLIHDLKPDEFADIYAETIAYGMFGARLHDTTLQDFSREEALTLLPKSNPFLRFLFTYVAGPNLDERIRRTIDELAEIFQATNLPLLFKDFGKFTQRNDPFIHFYETFLAAYNPAKRKARGVWYTPEPVVNFIVRAVDDVLKTEFGLPLGLADTSKVTVDWDTGHTKKGKPVMDKREVHRVQILDPAAGTGTFLAEVIKQIAPKVKDVAEGQWSSYVEKELIPRLHGFELLMASYAMCHMKLDMMLTEMGYKPTTADPPRLSVYLTNSLEEGDRQVQDLFWAKPLSEEAKKANELKRDMPIMCVIGNPPYSGVSHNNGSWITQKIEDYKYVEGLHFGEKKHWLQDDYVKFIRFAEYLIAKNGEGVLGFITNHGYLENTTFRAMRWHLLQTFDEVRVLDLHGSSIKGQISPSGAADKNVFDIQVGVAIVIAYKRSTKKKTQNAKVRHGELWGSRDSKYERLWSMSGAAAFPEKLQPLDPLYLFAQPAAGPKEEYDKGFSITDLMPLNITGIVTMGDAFIVAEKPSTLRSHIELLQTPTTTIDGLNIEFGLGKNYAAWIYENRQNIRFEQEKVVPFAYRPLDNRYTYFDNKLIWRWREPVMRHLLDGENFALLLARQTKDEVGGFVVNCIAGHKSFSGYDITSCLPLYLQPDRQSLDQTRRVNFDPKIRKAIEEKATDASRPAARAPQHEGKLKVPDELAIFDYIYGVLHCPAYRDIYKEFLKIDFPRVPYPPSPDVFWDVSAKGTQLRKLHLMEDAAIGATPFKFIGAGDNVVGKLSYEGEVVRINETQGFEGVPAVAWNFYIGGYQPAQKWLKDRKGRELSFDDIRHYQKIIKILQETDRIMKTITMPL